MFKKLFISFLFLSLLASPLAAGNAPWTKVWAKIYHSQSFEFTGVVLIQLDENTLQCTTTNCPDEDVTLVGDAYDIHGDYMGLHAVKVKRGYLNDPNHWTYEQPKIKPKKANNFTVWEI